MKKKLRKRRVKASQPLCLSDLIILAARGNKAGFLQKQVEQLKLTPDATPWLTIGLPENNWLTQKDWRELNKID